jgi:hypothetical protein
VSESAGRRTVRLERLDLKGTGIAEDLQVVIVARAGATSVRHELGPVAAFDREDRSLDGLDASKPLRFRVLLHAVGNPKLVASVENLCARDEAQGESLLPMEPADLGERVWKLEISEEGPVLQFNSRLFPSASGAENFVPFGAMVLPEALRQVMAIIAEEPERLDDEGDPLYLWGTWIDSIGEERPVSEDDDLARGAWCDRIIDRFCSRCMFASKLKAELEKGAIE